jgi:hypothetical protein
MAHREIDIIKKQTIENRSNDSSSRSGSARLLLNEPLIDSEWLLGPKRGKIKTKGVVFISTFLVALFVVGILSSTTLMRTWLYYQLADQFQNGTTKDSRRDGLVGLAKLLPTSLDQVVLGLSKTEQSEANLAFRALDEYVKSFDSLPIEKRRALAAEIAYALEKQLPSVSPATANLIGRLASSLIRSQSNDAHPGATMTLAACDQLIQAANRQSQSVKTKQLTASKASLSDQPRTSARLSDSTPVLATEKTKPKDDPEFIAGNFREVHEVSPRDAPHGSTSTATRVSAHLGDEPALIPQDVSVNSAKLAKSESGRAPNNSTASLISQKPLIFQSEAPTAFASPVAKSTVMNSEEFRSLRQKIHQANRFLPVTGSMSVPIESSAASLAKPSVDQVIGIDRQKTEDLLKLLTSIQPRVATAAFHELERNRLSRDELELAVELARGTTVQRIASLERLAENPRIDPMILLTWMANESDRDVRYKAISLIGSLNSDEAQAQLRNLSNRERDQEISQHIHKALQALGAAPSTKR